MGRAFALPLLLVSLLSCVCAQENRGAIRYAQDFPGADLGEKIHAAAMALPQGGTVDAQAITGPQIIRTDIFAGVRVPIILLLGDTSITCNKVGFSWCIQIPASGNVNIRGHGRGKTILKLVEVGSTPVRIISTAAGAENVEISELDFDGNVANQDKDMQDACIFLNAVRNGKVHDNTFHDCNGDGVSLHGDDERSPNRNISVYDNVGYGRFRQFITLIDAEHIHIMGNRSTQSFGDCIHSEPYLATQIVRDIEIDHNRCEPQGGDGNISFTSQIAGGSGRCQDYRVHDNTLVRARQILVLNSWKVALTHNVVVDSLNEGNYFYGAISVASKDSTIENNDVEWRSVAASVGSVAGIYVAAPNVSVRSNVVKRANGAGIVLRSAPGAAVVGNQIDGVLPNKVGAAACFYVDGPGSGNNVWEENLCEDSQQIPTTKYMIAGFNNDAGPTTDRANVYRNLLNGKSSGSIRLISKDAK